MDMDMDLPRVCMADKRCRLCQFNFRHGDLVVARIENNRFSSEFTLRIHYEIYEVDTIHDSRQGVRIHTCAGQYCKWPSYRVPFFHSGCLGLMRSTVSDALVTARAYTFEPPEYEEHRRFNRIQNLLAPKLKADILTSLPGEIVTIIARLLVRECAAISAEEQSLGTNIFNSSIDLLGDVYATYITVDGVRYVKSLANETSESCDKDAHVLVSKRGEAVHKVWMAENFRGIRFIRFCSSTAEFREPTPIAESWWRAISIPDGNRKMAIGTDGVKLRNLGFFDAAVYSNPNTFVGWASPERAANIVDLLPSNRVTEVLRPRMTFFDCNTEGITGYTATIIEGACAAIHAHVPGGDARLYAEMDAAYPGSHIVHMPLDDGEFVTEICRNLISNLIGGFTVGLVFITNKGRCALFGTNDLVDYRGTLDTILIPAPDGSRIFFNYWNSVREKSIRFIAHEKVPPPTQRPFPSSLASRLPLLAFELVWFYASCNMRGVVVITLCRDISLPHKPILGMLLEYDNGHRDCLGQFRYDKSLEDVRVDQTTELYIGSQRTVYAGSKKVVRSSLYIADLSTSPPTGQGETSWIKASLDGTLEWWATERHSLVRCISDDGQSSDNTAIPQIEGLPESPPPTL